MRNITESVKLIAQPWIQSSYYDAAEKWTYLFWDEDKVFAQFFSQLNASRVVELACGHGRHSERAVQRCGELILMDVVPQNIEFCRSRLRDSTNISYIVGNGHTFDPIRGNSVTAIFCYDAMVHFSADLVESYLKDACRILTNGGKALLHHSNYSAVQNDTYGTNPGARNYMSFELLQELAAKAGLTIEESQPLKWAGVDDLDRVTLLSR